MSRATGFTKHLSLVVALCCGGAAAFGQTVYTNEFLIPYNGTDVWGVAANWTNGAFTSAVPGFDGTTGDSNDVAWIKRVLDSGAEGIILPRAYSAQEVAQFVSAYRYPPLETRGSLPRAMRSPKMKTASLG